MNDYAQVVWTCGTCRKDRTVGGYPVAPSLQCGACGSVNWITDRKQVGRPMSLEDRISALEEAAREAGWADHGWLK